MEKQAAPTGVHANGYIFGLVGSCAAVASQRPNPTDKANAHGVHICATAIAPPLLPVGCPVKGVGGGGGGGSPSFKMLGTAKARVGGRVRLLQNAA